MTMIDFAPELESSKVLLENLYWFCQLQAGKEEVDINQIEYDWTEKLVQIIDNFHDKGKNMKNERMKHLFARRNLENNYQFCFGNPLIKQTLEHYNIFLGKRDERIERMTESSGAISISEAIEKMNEDTSKQKEKRQYELDAEALSRQSNSSNQSKIGETYSQTGSISSADSSPVRSKRLVKKRKLRSSSEEYEMESQESGQKRKRDDEVDDDDFFDHPDDADFADQSFPIQKIAEVVGTPGKRIEVRTAGGGEMSFVANEKTTIYEVTPVTPVRRILREPSLPSPVREGRAKNWIDEDKLELAKLYIEFATVITPFDGRRGKENPIKHDMRQIRRNQSFGGKSLKERCKDPDNLAAFMTGKAKGFSGQPKGQGLKHIIDECLEEEYPDVHHDDWTPQMMRDIRDKILERMKTFMNK